MDRAFMKPHSLYSLIKLSIPFRLIFNYNILPRKKLNCTRFLINIYCFLYTAFIISTTVIKLTSQTPFALDYLLLFIALEQTSVFIFLYLPLKFLPLLQEHMASLRIHLSSSEFKKLRTIEILTLIIWVLTVIVQRLFSCYFTLICEPLIISSNILVHFSLFAHYELLFIICYYDYFIMAKLRKQVTKVCRMAAGYRAIKAGDIRRLYAIYGQYAIGVGEMVTAINPVMFTTIVCTVSQMICSMYSVLSQYQKEGISFGLVVLSFDWLIGTLLPTLPGVMLQMTAGQVDSMMLTLLETHCDVTDEALKLEIDDFLNYMENRPFKFDVIRHIPLDGTLPINLISFCVTYMIVVVQFTHLYD